MKSNLIEKYQERINRIEDRIEFYQNELKEDGLDVVVREDCRAEIRRFKAMREQVMEFLRDIEAIKDDFYYEPIDITNGKFWTNR